MRNRNTFYSDDDQNSIMQLIDSKAWPSEAVNHKTPVEFWTEKVNQYRRWIDERTAAKEDAAEFIQLLAEAEKKLNEAIDLEESLKNNNEPLPY